MAHKISEIKGLDADIQVKLETAKVLFIEDLLKETDTPAKRSALAKQLASNLPN